jgi:hypothetical protein
MKKREEEESLNKLEGKMLTILRDLREQTNPPQITLAGINLGPARCRIFT